MSWELEAESVAFLVSKRNGVESKSKTYLSDYVQKSETVESLDLYQIITASQTNCKITGLRLSARHDGRLARRLVPPRCCRVGDGPRTWLCEPPSARASVP